ncbi:hypothetical protein H7I76_03470 [Mycolicibacterium vaccae]|nr:hypothetical protein [Mycolicibacterium vaccae]
MLIVIDDDPTGTQSVSDLPVLTRWTPDDLAWAAAESPAVYLQTNSRSLSEQDAFAITSDAAAAALRTFGYHAILVSRSDSTLRGHFPAETDALIAASSAAGIAVDTVVLAPAFPQAGRITVEGVRTSSTGAAAFPWRRQSSLPMPPSDTAVPICGNGWSKRPAAATRPPMSRCCTVTRLSTS